MSDVADRPRPMTRRGVFVDLAIVMVALGIAVGVVFPVAIMALRVPAAIVLRPSFFAATTAAGVVLGGLNFAIAHRVVGTRLRMMADRMRYVGDVIKEATFTGDWSSCDPGTCELPKDSDDAIGTAAAEFNRLMYALSDSRAVERALSGFTSGLSQHLTRDDLADVMVQRMVQCVGGTSGALLTVRDGRISVEATTGAPNSVLQDPQVRAAALGTSSVMLEHGAWDGDPFALDDVARVLVMPLRDGEPGSTAHERQGEDGTLGALVTCLPAASSPTVVRLAEMMRGTAAVALDNAVTHQRVQVLASTDALTGLDNRRTGRARLEQEWISAVRRGQPLSVMMLDLDHFKAINDTYGHDAGDRVLEAVASALREVVRDHDHVFRSGGEEFVAVLPGTAQDGLRAVAERVRRRIADLRVAVGDDIVVTVTTSVGGVSLPDSPCESAEQMLRYADVALYDAKAGGRDRVVVHGLDGAAALTDVGLATRTS